MSEERPRIQFQVEPDIKRALERKLRWGQLRMVYLQITEDLVELLEKHDPQMVVAAILSKEVSLADYIGKNKGGDDGKYQRSETEHKRDGTRESSEADAGDTAK